MQQITEPSLLKRYGQVEDKKAFGATYTPPELADFVADQMVRASNQAPRRVMRLLDPAMGDGELLLSLAARLIADGAIERLEIWGFDRDPQAVEIARSRIAAANPNATVRFQVGDFLEFAAKHGARSGQPSLFGTDTSQTFDFIIANPPYVRTQILGSVEAQRLVAAFGLSGRLDLYHVFLLALARLLDPSGTAGVIASNRFMTTRGGAAIRSALRQETSLHHIWDLGDTKIFDAAVLPAILLLRGRAVAGGSVPAFTSIYETRDIPTLEAFSPIAALGLNAVAALPDGRRFRVQQGALDVSGGRDDIWRIATDAGDTWLDTVKSHSWATFGDIGKVRVGVKTCADKVFIRKDWAKVEGERPELLRALTTHHVARRYRASVDPAPRSILYPHEVANGRRQAVSLGAYPNSKRYLEAHRSSLEARTYVTEAGRAWYEIWVPQDPDCWPRPKLVFRDISERPTFWLDLDGTVINGDCYWMTADDADDTLLWLAAGVANSTFAEAFYDRRFNNKLYAGRRRFITQYVEKFPLPDPAAAISKEIVRLVKAAYGAVGTPAIEPLEAMIDTLVWRAFGSPVKELPG